MHFFLQDMFQMTAIALVLVISAESAEVTIGFIAENLLYLTALYLL